MKEFGDHRRRCGALLLEPCLGFLCRRGFHTLRHLAGDRSQRDDGEHLRVVEGCKSGVHEARELAVRHLLRADEESQRGLGDRDEVGACQTREPLRAHVRHGFGDVEPAIHKVGATPPRDET
eukprot:CAMPEP_0180107164 /NCGR_PEP_ID=MMETSP0985-20121206/33105_1 /TAXON_ID=483367 /ORGANISM="non described non described, Strain CCMP 2436" /LENGTH=121 /DNA_ID=CAMNT_0022044587 /DNA_START=1332 /DNA_END=1697 /DNA_ORIENTATION=+